MPRARENGVLFREVGVVKAPTSTKACAAHKTKRSKTHKNGKLRSQISCCLRRNRKSRAAWYGRTSRAAKCAPKVSKASIWFSSQTHPHKNTSPLPQKLVWAVTAKSIVLVCRSCNVKHTIGGWMCGVRRKFKSQTRCWLRAEA